MIAGQSNWKNELERILHKAGALLLSYYGKALTRVEKQGNGFVTEADKASEDLLIHELGKLFPQASFFAEESGISGNTNTAYCWVIDPLDGTTNFAHGLPYFCISIALTYHNVPVIGAIYNPIMNEFFYAEQGCGAYLNGTRIRVSSPQFFAQSIVAIGIPYGQEERMKMIQKLLTLGNKAYAVRHYGAIALDLAYVAAGRYDGLIFDHLKWWDVAAGVVLVTEAGGIVSDFKGKALDPQYTSCIAAGNQLMYEELRAQVA